MKNGFSEITPFRIHSGRVTLEGNSYSDLLNQFTALPLGFVLNTVDFRRGGEKVKQAILGAACAFFDAETKPDDSIAILGYGHDGCFTENRLYFDDYTSHGRDGGRGQLFVGTLATTPLCEAAIALNMHGPAFYLDADRHFIDRELLLFSGPVLLLEFQEKSLRTTLWEGRGCGS